jgi:hypothetical protein
MSQPAVPPRPGPPPFYGPGPYPPQPQYPNQPPQQFQQPPPQQFHQPQPSPETRKDVAAAWAARLELGMDYEDHIAAGLAQRVEELAAIRAGELRYQAEAARRVDASEQSGRGKQFALGIVSLSLGVPITAITGVAMDSGNLTGMAIAWAGIVGVNLAHALSLRKRRS